MELLHGTEQEVGPFGQQGFVGKGSRVDGNSEDPSCHTSLNTEGSILHDDEVVGGCYLA